MVNPGFQAAQDAQRAAQANRQAAAQAASFDRQARDAAQRANQDAMRFSRNAHATRPRSTGAGPIGRFFGAVVMLVMAAFAIGLILAVASHFDPGLVDHLFAWLKAHA